MERGAKNILAVLLVITLIVTIILLLTGQSDLQQGAIIGIIIAIILGFPQFINTDPELIISFKPVGKENELTLTVGKRTKDFYFSVKVLGKDGKLWGIQDEKPLGSSANYIEPGKPWQHIPSRWEPSSDMYEMHFLKEMAWLIRYHDTGGYEYFAFASFKNENEILIPVASTNSKRKAKRLFRDFCIEKRLLGFPVKREKLKNYGEGYVTNKVPKFDIGHIDTLGSTVYTQDIPKEEKVKNSKEEEKPKPSEEIIKKDVAEEYQMKQDEPKEATKEYPEKIKESAEEIILEGIYPLEPGEWTNERLNVSEGDRITGYIREEEGLEFDYYIANEKNMLRFDNRGNEGFRPSKSGVDNSTYPVRWKAPRGKHWYLILALYQKSRERQIEVLLRKMEKGKGEG